MVDISVIARIFQDLRVITPNQEECYKSGACEPKIFDLYISRVHQ